MGIPEDMRTWMKVAKKEMKKQIEKDRIGTAEMRTAKMRTAGERRIGPVHRSRNPVKN